MCNKVSTIPSLCTWDHTIILKDMHKDKISSRIESRLEKKKWPPLIGDKQGTDNPSQRWLLDDYWDEPTSQLSIAPFLPLLTQAIKHTLYDTLTAKSSPSHSLLPHQNPSTHPSSPTVATEASELILITPPELIFSLATLRYFCFTIVLGRWLK